MGLRKFTESYADFAIALMAGACHYFLWRAAYPKDHAGELFTNVITLSGVAVGFLATGEALLCSLNDNFVVKTLRDCKRFDDMLRFFSKAIGWCFLLILLSLLSYWLDFQAHPMFFSVWLGFFGGSLVSTVRILRLFSKIVHGAK